MYAAGAGQTAADGTGRNGLFTEQLLNSLRTPQNLSFRIGDIGPAGGIIFYDKGNNNDGWRYLEAAPASSEFRSTWGTVGRDVVNTRTEIGTGRQNIRLNSESGSAAQRCLQLNINGYTDLFLPSKDELNLMFTNLAQRGFGSFQGTWYWSSSQHDMDFVWCQDFASGGQPGYYKYHINNVRAVRAF